MSGLSSSFPWSRDATLPNPHWSGKTKSVTAGLCGDGFPLMHRSHRLCVPVLALFFATNAQASEQSESDVCGTRADFERELKLRLGEDAPVSAARFTITPREGGYHLQVQVGSELRELDDPSCAELFRASIVIAVAILMHGRETAQNAKAPAPPPTAPPPKPAPVEYPRFTLSGGGGVNFGTLPKPALAFELEGQSLWRRWGVALQVRYLPFNSSTGSRGPRLEEANAVGLGSAVIFRPARRWQTRLGFAVQRLSGTGRGTASNRQDHVWAAGPTLGLGWLPLEGAHWCAGVGAEGQLNAVRGRFEVLNYSGKLAESHVIYPVPWLAFSSFVRFGLVW